VNLETLLREHRVAIAPENHEHSRAGWLQFDCPFCNLQHHYRMGYNLRHRYVNCWACGSKSLPETLALITGKSYSHVKGVIAGFERITVPGVVRKVAGVLKMPKPLVPLTKAHRAYLRSRDMDPDELVRLWGLQATNGLAGKKSWRIIAPITWHNKVVSWTSRAITKKGMRWLSASLDEEIINHKTILYGFDYVRHSAIICEGPSDVWNVGPGAVGVCGIGFRQAQVNLLSKLAVRIVCFDTSEDAQRRANDLCDALMVFPGKTINVVLDAEDPGAASKREVARLRRLLS
jgi:hypothetical protein